ncbi:hypothetical protein FB385_3142 [Paramicrobacterium agarici]|nr:hypothetical protein FB385_3142 [Microbacterium agarici]
MKWLISSDQMEFSEVDNDLAQSGPTMFDLYKKWPAAPITRPGLRAERCSGARIPSALPILYAAELVSGLSPRGSECHRLPSDFDTVERRGERGLEHPLGVFGISVAHLHDQLVMNR